MEVNSIYIYIYIDIQNLLLFGDLFSELTGLFSQSVHCVLESEEAKSQDLRAEYKCLCCYLFTVLKLKAEDCFFTELRAMFCDFRNRFAGFAPQDKFLFAQSIILVPYFGLLLIQSLYFSYSQFSLLLFSICGQFVFICQ